MNNKVIKITALLASMTCIAMTGCGHDVPADSNVSGTFQAPDQVQETEPTSETTDIAVPEETSAETTKSGDTEEETTASTEPATTAKPYVAGGGNINKPSGGSTGNNSNTTANNGGSAGGNTGSSGTGSGNGTGSGAGTGSGNANTAPTEAVTGITLSYYSADVFVGQTIGYPVVSENIDEVWTSSDTSIATVDVYGNITGHSEGNCVIRVSSKTNSKLGAEVKVTVKKAEGIQVIDNMTYVQGILIANKTYSLPSTYNPGGLTSDTSSAFQELVNAAANDGLNIYNSSGFRSYDYQSQIYNNYCAIYGQASADTFSARPGYSEHQTGMAIDCNIIDDSFTGTPEAIWLENHCWEYGFIIRYPQGKQEITGYKYEPWHIRYIGKENAKAVHDAAAACGDPYLTLEEYLNITSYYH